MELRVVAGGLEPLVDVLRRRVMAGEPASRLPPLASAIAWKAAMCSRMPATDTASRSFGELLLFGAPTPSPGNGQYGQRGQRGHKLSLHMSPQ